MKWTALVIGAAALIVGGCAGYHVDSVGHPPTIPTGDGAACTMPTAAADVSHIPKEFDASSVGVVTSVLKQPDFVSIQLVIPASMSEAVRRVESAITDAGYSVVGSENEESDAEIFIRTPNGDGSVMMHEASCGQQAVSTVALPEA